MNKNKKMKSNILNGCPVSSELEYHMHDNYEMWKNLSDKEVVSEVRQIISAYYDPGHVMGEGLNPNINGAPLEYRKEAKKVQAERRRELQELKEVLKYAENKIKFDYTAIKGR
jgi:hypothetical protein